MQIHFLNLKKKIGMAQNSTQIEKAASNWKLR